ncbi:Hsp20/alpha crystallin family protein [Streptomyces sp. AA1529]|uniref:Hsp20/alpha crystallin family protein n=1 Tax=Streptomyces sp. AA1529 TaxID=1203257 RepID=UPI000D12AA8D|nr:Hsp20/alpha crystallin family protein [Streptomyces sp. AA1529]
MRSPVRRSGSPGDRWRRSDPVGVHEDQITVEVSVGEPDVPGDVRERERSGTVRRHTRRIGGPDHRTTLPRDSDAEHTGAEPADGIVTVNVPKAGKGLHSASRSPTAPEQRPNP